MRPSTIADITALPTFRVRELRHRYETVFQEPARSFNKAWLVRRIAWRLQALDEGDLSERARLRAVELSQDAEIRVLAPKQPAVAAAMGHQTTIHAHLPQSDYGLPAPGTLLTRTYKGEVIRVTVLQEGFSWKGTVYGSLTAVAKAITGSHMSGRAFFGLKREAA